MTSISKEQCVEFAQLDELYLHHWRLLTGITSSKDESFIYSKEGIFPVQYTDEELSKLAPCEQFEIGEFCASEPLLFPCLPSSLLHFIDNRELGGFSVPDDFREAVEQSINSRRNSEDQESNDPSSRWAKRKFIDGFNSVLDATIEAKQSPVIVSDDRCREIAGELELHIDHWIELVGIGVGQHESYLIGPLGITFRQWDDESVLSSSLELQKEMLSDNRTAPTLDFPCSPSQLLEFVDLAIGIHQFTVPPMFRSEVGRSAKIETEVVDESLDVHHDAVPSGSNGIEAPDGIEQQAPVAILDLPESASPPESPAISSEKQGKKTNKRNRVTPMQALIKRFVDDGINPNIAEFWLHAKSNGGKDGFPVASLGDSSLTTVEGKQFTRTQIDGALKIYRKAHKSV